ncbi:MAG: hypothetical protein QNJ19_18110 [Woeseiaceae bacterium]|nr:hypothetical protein [Woeseiaceae bacterium]
MSSDTGNRRSPTGALVFVASVLALAGYFLAWLPWYERQQPVSADEQLELDQQLAVTSENLQLMIGERLSVEQMAEERDRQYSQLGQELSLRCLQWTDLNDSQPSESTKRFQEWACKRFNHYVTTGELLPEEPQSSDSTQPADG